MRALPIRCGGSVNDYRLLRLKEPMQIGHRRVKREQIVELERGVLALHCERTLAAKCNPVRVADRRHRGEAVKRAPQYDSKKARIAAFSPRKLRHKRPGEQSSGG